ncbi:MAG: DUF1259 domain-containing protein [Deltaproteobacteria bacterium]|nr:DUF1259 domain-containing protein [Deltaproteobacteria bacterium]
MLALGGFGCGNRPPAGPASLAASPSVAAPLDERSVAAALGVDRVETSGDGVVKASFPRKDVEVTVDGWRMPPFMGLTSWAAFTRGRSGVAEAMVMGDIVLFEDEVSSVLSALLEGGVAVTALHNHFFFDSPKVFFLHIGGEGTVASLATAVKAAMATVSEIRKRDPRPSSTFKAPALPETSSIDAARLEATLGVKGTSKDGMFKMVVGRKATTASCGCPIGKTMGVNTWAAFAGNDEIAVVDGDFAVSEDELQPVLKALRAGAVNVVAIHHHMTGETPRVLFVHYWGRGKAVELATTVRRALDLTAFDKGS